MATAWRVVTPGATLRREWPPANVSLLQKQIAAIALPPTLFPLVTRERSAAGLTGRELRALRRLQREQEFKLRSARGTTVAVSVAEAI